jgi:hypothetical protein
MQVSNQVTKSWIRLCHNNASRSVNSKNLFISFLLQTPLCFWGDWQLLSRNRWWVKHKSFYMERLGSNLGLITCTLLSRYSWPLLSLDHICTSNLNTKKYPTK